MGKVACIGVGTVGSAWSVVFAKAGHQVTLFDRAGEAIVERALIKARETLGLLEEAGFLTEDIETILGRISQASSIKNAVTDADHVQETVREDVDLKREVCGEIARHAKPDCIIASSTSAIMGSSFLGDIANPERALVAHPVNPPSLIPLVELCGSKWTSDETLSRTEAFMSNAGMKPIIVNKEIDGFILNRLQYTLVAEAMHLVGEGYCTAADIDRVMTDGLALRWASAGPFEVAHLNAAKGFQGFVDQLGPMMKQMGAKAKTDYDWGAPLAEAIHQSLAERCPVSEIPERQNWRDGRILATRNLQKT